MIDLSQLQKLRPLGKLEQLSAACHHLGFYHNVGLSARYSSKPLDPPSSTLNPAIDVRRLVLATLARVLRKSICTVLFAIPVNEDSPDAYFAGLPSIDLARSVLFITRSHPVAPDGQDPELDAILQEQHNTNFKSEYGTLPFWRLLIVRNAGEEQSFTASFIFHHSIGDGAAGLIFHKEFQAALNVASSTSLAAPDPNETYIVTAPKDITLLPPLEELHPLPINADPTQLPTGLKEWTGNPIHAPCITRYQSLYLSPSSSKAFINDCKEGQLSLTSVLPSVIAAAFYEVLPPTIEALTCIVPVNLRPWLDLPRNIANDAIGTFIDAFKVQLHRSDHIVIDGREKLMLPARETAKEITKYLTGNPSPSGEPFTNVAIFKTIPNVAVVFNSTLGNDRDAAFEVSNLGAFPASLNTGDNAHWQLGRMTFSRSSVVSGSAVTMSIVSGGDGALTIGFSWQKDVVEDALVDRLVHGVKRYFEMGQSSKN